MAIIDDRTAGRNYALPNAANKLKDDVVRLRLASAAADTDVTAILLAMAGKSDVGHGHGIGAISGLQSALDGKVSVGYHDNLDDLADVSVTGAADGQVLIKQGASWIPINLQVGNITSLETLLNGKADGAGTTAALALKASLASPSLTGTPTAPTAADGTNTTQVATTAFAQEVGAGRVSFAAQSKTPSEKGQALANIGAGVLAGFRNKVINGDIEVDQRGITVANGYGPDLWKAQAGTGATHSISRSATRFDFDFGRKYYLQWARSVAGSSPCYATQPIEYVRTFAGRRVTVSFWAGAGGAIVPLGVYLQQQFGSGGSASVTSAITTVQTTGALITRFDVVIDLPSIAGKVIGVGDNLTLGFIRNHNDANPLTTVNITSISVVDGDATADLYPFAPRHIQQEIALCQRYYETGSTQLYLGASAAGPIGFTVPYREVKRSPATLVFSNPPTGATAIPLLDSINDRHDKFSVNRTGGNEINFSWVADAGI